MRLNQWKNRNPPLTRIEFSFFFLVLFFFITFDMHQISVSCDTENRVHTHRDVYTLMCSICVLHHTDYNVHSARIRF